MMHEHKKKVEQNQIGTKVSRNYEIKNTDLKFDNGIIVSKPIGVKFTTNVISRGETEKIEKISDKLKKVGYHDLENDSWKENFTIREIESETKDEKGYTFVWTEKTKRVGISFFPKIKTKKDTRLYGQKRQKEWELASFQKLK
jgi:hypothetical protein